MLCFFADAAVTSRPAILTRHNVRTFGSGVTAMVFAHGFGCDQNMWRFVTPAFEQDYQIVLFDYLGHGQSDMSGYDARKYDALQGYAEDVIEICRALGLRSAIFVGHSVSAMIGVLAAKAAPELFSQLVLIGPSPRYINDVGYTGGFERADIDGLLEALDSNYLGWSSAMAPVIMGNADRPQLGTELANSFCRTDPAVARQFARATFLSDNRGDLADVRARCLVLQCADDVIAPDAVGQFVHEQLPHSELVRLTATGHCPNLSAPDETIAAMKAFLESWQTT
jgi:sigma-B regulation protein RsbQ